MLDHVEPRVPCRLCRTKVVHQWLTCPFSFHLGKRWIVLHGLGSADSVEEPRDANRTLLPSRLGLVVCRDPIRCLTQLGKACLGDARHARCLCIGIKSSFELGERVRRHFPDAARCDASLPALLGLNSRFLHQRLHKQNIVEEYRNVYILANIAIRVCFDNLLDCCTRVELLSWGHSGSLLSRS